MAIGVAFSTELAGRWQQRRKSRATVFYGTLTALRYNKKHRHTLLGSLFCLSVASDSSPQETRQYLRGASFR
jgi:hypothetical protein